MLHTIEDVNNMPIYIFSIVVTLLSDWGTLFYFAYRVGQNNEKIKMWKFRSMRGENEASLRLIKIISSGGET